MKGKNFDFGVKLFNSNGDIDYHVTGFSIDIRSHMARIVYEKGSNVKQAMLSLDALQDAGVINLENLNKFNL